MAIEPVEMMTLSDALKKASENNCAIKQSHWPDGCYAFHGMDNVLRMKQVIDSEEEIFGNEANPSIAMLINKGWVLVPGVPYHGKKLTQMDNDNGAVVPNTM